jgi:hypothetical protein
VAEANKLLDRAATARQVLRRVGGRPLTPSHLIAESSVSSPAAGIVVYHVRDQSPPLAAALATAYARQFSKYAGRGRVVAAARAERVGTGAFGTVALGATAGLLLGMIVALLWDAIVLRGSRRPLIAKLSTPPATARSLEQEPLAAHASAPPGIALDDFSKGGLTPMSSDKQRLVTDVSALEEEHERLRACMDDAQQTLEALDRQKAQAAGTVMNARRALDDLEQRLAETRQALAAAEREEASRTLEVAVAERDAAAMQLAETVEQTLADVDSLEAARAAAAAVHQAYVSGPGRTQPVKLSPEPVALAETWNRLVARIRTELDQNLEDELLEAAARSPLAHAIDDLPAHLRAAARQRRRALMTTYKERERQEAESDRAERGV